MGQFIQAYWETVVDRAAPDPKPEIISISFPKELRADQSPYSATVRFRDPQGDVTKVSLQYIVPGKSELYTYALGARGQPEGSFRFTLRCNRVLRLVTMRVILYDKRGHESAPRDFSYRCVAPPRP
jgi:hypothetical protein